ncbi:lipoyl synthase [Chloroflexota bacterium]
MVSSVKPEWFRRRVPDSAVLAKMKELMDGLQLYTVCESAHCPNRGECFSRGVATFMILGNVCTRNCTFCAVEHGQPVPPDVTEPEHVVEAIKKLGLRHVVITSVARDDLSDGGAYQFAKVVEAIHSYNPQISAEVLIPDFQGFRSALEVIVASHPAIINHNVETVPRLYPQVRPEANYERSFQLLKHAKSMKRELLTKSGLMVGLGERREEVIQVMEDLRKVDCDFLTIGQYLRPSINHHEVVRFAPPVEFEEYKNNGVAMGFRGVASASFVRSSFQADKMFKGINHLHGSVDG